MMWKNPMCLPVLPPPDTLNSGEQHMLTYNYKHGWTRIGPAEQKSHCHHVESPPRVKQQLGYARNPKLPPIKLGRCKGIKAS
eukprot:19480_4